MDRSPSFFYQKFLPKSALTQSHGGKQRLVLLQPAALCDYQLWLHHVTRLVMPNMLKHDELNPATLFLTPFLLMRMVNLMTV